MENTWFWRPAPRINAGMRLFCFPYAGGNSITIYRRWPALLPAEIEVIAIQLPGRGNRIAEPPSRRVSDIIAPLSRAMAPLLDKPVSFFGYSMGGLICFELAHALRRQYGVEPTHLALAARRAPQDPAERQITYNLPLSEFIAEIQKYNGLPSESLKDKEMMGLIIPILRADMELCQTSTHTPGRPFGCPITVFGGYGDEITEDDLDLWKEHTHGRFAKHMFSGDHFFINTAEKDMVGILSSELLGAPQPIQV
jgi:medium-chain acyl-[acyl-carrier-protein] hydrolase